MIGLNIKIHCPIFPDGGSVCIFPLLQTSYHAHGWGATVFSGYILTFRLIGLSPLDLGPGLDLLRHGADEIGNRNPHLLDQLRDQPVLLGQKSQQEMLLLNLLISVFQSDPLTALGCLYRFLRKFLNIFTFWDGYRMIGSRTLTRVPLPGSESMERPYSSPRRIRILRWMFSNAI